MNRTIIDVNVSVNGRDAFGKRITPSVLLETLDFNHITHAVCYNEFAQRDVRKGNSDMRQIAEASNGRLGLSVLLDPALGAESLPGEGTLIERLQEWKPESIRILTEDMRAVFSVFYWEEILDAANALSLPVLIDQTYTPDFFYHLPEVAAHYPNAKFILVQYGFCGSRNIFPLVKKCSNVYFTADMMLDNHQIEEIVERGNGDKLLFGTAYPKVTMAGALGLALYADISEENRDKLLYKNWEAIKG